MRTYDALHTARYFMSLTRYVLLAAVLWLWTPAALAQDNRLLLLEENMEQLAMEDEERDWEDELEDLSRRMDEPLNLNAATKEELEQFGFLTDLQIENIQAYVYIHGPMQTLYELQLVEGMDKRSIEMLLPFVCVRPVERQESRPSLQDILRYGRHEILARADVPFYTRKGYRKDYLGPSLYHSLRYSFRYGDQVQFGLTGEKDAGEPFLALHNRKGYDYYAYYLLLKDLGRLEALALGTYRLNFGQGLVMGSSFGLGKSFSLGTTGYRTEGIRNHGSTDEYNYLRGAAATVRLGRRWQATAFYSYRTLDGVIENGHITSIAKDGLHRTQKEADKMNCLSQQVVGGNLNAAYGALKMGLTGICYFFDRPYEPALRTYSRYNLRGNRFYNLGLDYRYRLGRFQLAGEAAMGKKGYAFFNRLRYDVAPGYALLLAHRYYAHDYWAWFARSFGEGSTPQNENGWYVAAETTALEDWRFFASADFFSFPWWRYRISKPSSGTELRLQAAWTPRSDVDMYANYRYKLKERDVTGTGGEDTRPTCHHRLRFRLAYTPSVWRFQTTADYNLFRQEGFEGSQGWQVTQQCACTLPGLPLSVSLQGTYFHADDYDSRVYAYERGLLYTFYTPSFYGDGFRCSAFLRCDIGNGFMAIAKLGHTVYRDRSSIGSGNDLIAGNRKTDLQVQLRMKF